MFNEFEHFTGGKAISGCADRHQKSCYWDIVDRIKNELIEGLKSISSNENYEEIMQTIHGLDALKKEIGLEQGRVIIK